MNVLSALTPRQVGHRVAEPAVLFDEVEQSVHAVNRCPITCDEACRATSHSVINAAE